MHKIVILILLILFSTSAQILAEEYRLIDDRYLEIGNQWNYQVHVTLEDNIPVDKWETSSETVTGTKNVSGHLTKIVRIIDSDGTGYEYGDLSNDYLLSYGFDDEGVHAIFINNNPIEVAPVWVNSTDNNRLMGTGDFQLQMDDPYYVWTGSFTSYVTYINQQVITVPAGTFSCIVVTIRAVYSDELGIQQEITETDYVDPEVGVIKSEVTGWMYNPGDGQTYHNTYTGSLTWTNIKPSIDKDVTSYDFGENEKTMNFDIWNDSLGTLNYQVSLDQGQEYFSVFPDPGSSRDITDKQTHTITVNYDNIPYNQVVTGRVKIESSWADDSPQFVDLSAERSFSDITCDFYEDGFVDFLDFAILANYFADGNCTEPNWCQGTDIDHSGNTEFWEFTLFIERWLCEAIDPDLVAHWPMDDNDSTTFVSDISGNGHNGTASANTDLLSAPGMIDTCFDFAGTDAVVIDDEDALSFGDGTNDSAFSIAAWVYVTSHTTEQRILSKWEEVNDAEWIFFLNPFEQLGFALRDESANVNPTVVTDQSLPAGWHFVVAVYDGTGGPTAGDGIILYIDGSAVDPDDTNIINHATYAAMENGATKAVIGASYDAAGTLQHYWQDKIDNVKIFSKCLTFAEIAALYDEGL